MKTDLEKFFSSLLERKGDLIGALADQGLIIKDGRLVQSNFKIGDWIVNNNGEPQFSQVTALSWPDSKIKGAEDNLESFINTVTLEKQYHLWTLQDAKEGDVLYCESGGIEYIVMSKGINEFGNIDSYFRYNSLDGFAIDIPSVLSAEKDGITPATKEQRDLLFKELKEVGYEWDAERKKLKKIEQSPACHRKFYETLIWRKCQHDELNQSLNIRMSEPGHRYLIVDGYEIEIETLLKLPKED